jgi:hypothetical protein
MEIQMFEQAVRKKTDTVTYLYAKAATWQPIDRKLIAIDPTCSFILMLAVLIPSYLNSFLFTFETGFSRPKWGNTCPNLPHSPHWSQLFHTDAGSFAHSRHVPAHVFCGRPQATWTVQQEIPRRFLPHCCYCCWILDDSHNLWSNFLDKLSCAEHLFHGTLDTNDVSDSRRFKGPDTTWRINLRTKDWTAPW